MGDLRDEHLGDEAPAVELGSYKGPHFDLTTKDNNRIGACHRIRDNPKIGCSAQQRRSFKPSAANKNSEEENRRGQPADQPQPPSRESRAVACVSVKMPPVQARAQSARSEPRQMCAGYLDDHDIEPE